jgi:hypothetical protein
MLANIIHEQDHSLDCVHFLGDMGQKPLTVIIFMGVINILLQLDHYLETTTMQSQLLHVHK